MTLGKNVSFRRAVLSSKGLDPDFIDEVLLVFSSYGAAVNLFHEAKSSLAPLRAYQIITAESKIAALKYRSENSDPARGTKCYTKLSEKILSKLPSRATFFRRLFCPARKE